MATLTDHGWGSPPLHTLVMANTPTHTSGRPRALSTGRAGRPSFNGHLSKRGSRSGAPRAAPGHHVRPDCAPVVLSVWAQPPIPPRPCVPLSQPEALSWRSAHLAGLPSPSAPSGAETLGSQRAPEETGCWAHRGWAPCRALCAPSPTSAGPRAEGPGFAFQSGPSWRALAAPGPWAAALLEEKQVFCRRQSRYRPGRPSQQLGRCAGRRWGAGGAPDRGPTFSLII